MATVVSTSSFGALLRRYRTQHGISQERLAGDAEISPRHLSCLETGKATPSRTMVLLLGSALDLTLRDRNALLQAAGFVAAYRDEPLDAPEAASLRRAVDLVLRGMEPNGAIACDRAWNILAMNSGAARPAYAKVRAVLDGIPDLPRPELPAGVAFEPFLTLHLVRGPYEARLFTTIQTIGTAVDAMAEELRIETYFPADDRTAALMRSLAGS